MKRNTRAAFMAAELIPQPPAEATTSVPLDAFEHYAHERRGYDPYDTARGITPDIWAAKPKRQ